MISAGDLRALKSSNLQDKLDRIENGLIASRRMEVSNYQHNVSGCSSEQITAIIKELKDSGYGCEYNEITMSLTISW